MLRSLEDADASWVADELQRFFFGSPQLLACLRANLLAAAPELVDDDATGGFKLRSTELHRAFVALLEGELDARALQLARESVRGVDAGDLETEEGRAGTEDAKTSDDSPWAKRQLMRVFHELRRRDNGGCGGSSDDSGSDAEHAGGASEAKRSGGDDPAAGWFPRAMLAAAEFDHFMVLARETARGNVWDMESMFS